MTTSASAGAAAAPGLPRDNPTVAQRMAGVVLRPGRTFERVVLSPQWRGVLLASTLAALLAGVSVMSTSVGRQALVDEWERTAASLGHEVDDAGYRQLESLSRYGPAYAVAGALISGPVVAVGVAAVLHAIFGRRRPRGRGFASVLAVTVHAGVILSLRQVVGAAMTFARETTVTALSVGAAFPGFDAASPAARALAFIDLFVLWWVVLLAIGAGRLYRRRTRSTVLAFVGVYLTLAALTAAAFAAAGATT